MKESVLYLTLSLPLKNGSAYTLNRFLSALLKVIRTYLVFYDFEGDSFEKNAPQNSPPLKLSV